MLLALIFACSSDSPTDFEGGTFQFTTQAVADTCYDGAMDVVFMPEGTPADFGSTIELPAWADLPSTYTISLQDPFTDMEVTVDAGATEGELAVRGAKQEDILLNDDQWAGCTGDLTIDVDLTIIDADNVEGAATLTTEAVVGDNCPVIDEDPCQIVLDLTGVRT